ncbi:MAG: NAD(P)-dependent alcohol dehydrogenase [Chloroflexota bacterium]
MKAFIRDRYGSPDVLEFADIEMPVVADDGVLVRVQAASVNQADLDYLHGIPAIARLGTGLRRPTNRGLGLDVAGRVEAVGQDVTRFRPGDEVFGDMTEFGYGAFAEYVAAPERAFAPKPAGITPEEAATVPQGAILAIQGLRARRPVGPGDKVLINGASGSVGPWAVQIAKAWGAEVTGVASTKKLDLVRSLGADHVIDYTREDFTRLGHRYDRILDVTATRSASDIRRALTPTGVYIVIGGSIARLFWLMIAGLVISATGSQKLGIAYWKPFNPEDVATLTELLEARKIAPVIDRRFPLEEVPQALRYVEDGHALGKVVITV